MPESYDGIFEVTELTTAIGDGIAAVGSNIGTLLASNVDKILIVAGGLLAITILWKLVRRFVR